MWHFRRLNGLLIRPPNYKLSTRHVLLLATLAAAFTGACYSKKTPALKEAALDIHVKGSGELLAGFGLAKITPNEQMLAESTYYLAGYGRGRAVTDVHDDVWARTIVFEFAGKVVAIVAYDLIGMHHSELALLREKAQQQGLEIDYLVMTSTHNHEAPDTLGLWGSGLTSGIAGGYLEYIRDQTLLSLHQAMESKRPTELFWSQASTKDLGLVKDTRPPSVIPDILTVLDFRAAGDQSSDQDERIATIVHWHCHPEAMAENNTSITSDFPHFVREHLEKRLGGTPTIYWSGAVGGLMAPMHELQEDNGTVVSEGTWEHSDLIGRRLAERAHEALQKPELIAPSFLAVASEIIDLPLDNYYYKFGLALDLFRRPMPSLSKIRTEIASMRLGPLTIQTIPGELYPELAFGPLDPPVNADFPDSPREEPLLLDLMPGKHKLILGLAQDELGYIIPANGWDEKKPFLGPEHLDSYGEENSIGIQTAPLIHASVSRLSDLVGDKVLQD